MDVANAFVIVGPICHTGLKNYLGFGFKIFTKVAKLPSLGVVKLFIVF